jgi:molecular chaperone HscB
VRINEAYQRLKDPLKRAAYLCELLGAPIQAHDNTAMPADFLHQQMELRESLEEARGEDELGALADELASGRKGVLDCIAQLLDVDHDAAAAAQQVRALMFLERFGADVEDRLAQLGQ